jgi:hypothetical protein
MKIIFLILVLFLTSCTTTTQGVFTKPNSNIYEFEQCKAQCSYEVEMLYSGRVSTYYWYRGRYPAAFLGAVVLSNIIDAAVERERKIYLYKLCMQSYGFTFTPKDY